MNSLGERIRNLRESKDLLLGQVTAYLEIDTALLSKMERGARRLTREQVVALSKHFGVDEKDLLTLWLSDKILNSVKDDKYAALALNKATELLTNKA
ncbi:Helix-turn-helix domain-containing protein [Saccharicrinis carchari]|uniref:Helix-turn-helix domain-containing protein n=1 Tax=Saccharicrinis carchari TaxID=1168039 RepID=A0A521FAQ6_SACCC|nr:helix-turn-helix transcriptional regulator [Saccharicrinis carchari]SMO92590.1 Helix-turn-helix domain-containing protein [Saccharicrinis carchari]